MSAAVKLYTEADQEKAERASRRGFFGACAAMVAAAVCPNIVYSIPEPLAAPERMTWIVEYPEIGETLTLQIACRWVNVGASVWGGP